MTPQFDPCMISFGLAFAIQYCLCGKNFQRQYPEENILHIQRPRRKASKQLMKAPTESPCSISARPQMHKAILSDCQSHLVTFALLYPKIQNPLQYEAREKQQNSKKSIVFCLTKTDALHMLQMPT